MSLATFVLAASCGGGGGGKSSGPPPETGGLDVRLGFEQESGGAIPDSVESVRIVFRSDSGPSCCVSVDPAAVPVDAASGQRLVSLQDLAPGPGSVEVAGFATPVAAAPDGVGETCSIEPAGAGVPCAEGSADTPSYGSVGAPVSVVSGGQSDAGPVVARALPFVVPGSESPAPGAQAVSPVAIRVAVADAVSGIAQSSVAISVDGDASAPVVLQPCDDAGETPCSADGELGVRGFIAVREARALSAGTREVQIHAINQAGSSVDAAYEFTVAGVGPTEPPSGTVTSPSRSPTPFLTPTQPSPTTAASPTTTASPTEAAATRTPRPTHEPATPTSTPTHPIPTPRVSRTSSPTATVSFTPSATRTPIPTVLVTPSPSGILFVAAEPAPVSSGAQYLLAARLDADANTDLIVVSPESNEVNILLGSADSTSRFNPGAVITFGTRLGSPALGDVNGDGNVDLLVPDDAERGVWILTGGGDGTFGTPLLREAGQDPVAAATADFDQATHDDVALADRSADRLLVLLNAGTNPPAFDRPRALPVEHAPESVIAGDFDLDGHPDLAALSIGGGDSQVLSVLYFQQLDQGVPVFSAPVTAVVGARASSLAAADLNGDQLPDFVLLSQARTTGNTDLVVVASGAAGTLVTPAVTTLVCPFASGSGSSCPAFAFALADFDEDGKTDLAAALDDPRQSSGGDLVSILGGRGDGGFGQATSVVVSRSPRAIAVGDFNGDGLIDIAVAGRRDSVVEALINVTVPHSPAGGLGAR